MSTEKMNSRERLLAALHNEETDRIPWSPLIDGYYSYGFKGKLRGDILAIQRLVGNDIMLRGIPVITSGLMLGTPWLELDGDMKRDEVVECGGVKQRLQWTGHELTRTYETPIGTLTDRYKTTDASPWLMYPDKYKIRTREDLPIYQRIIEAQRYSPDYAEFERNCQEVGNDGLVSTSAPISPFQALLERELGVEMFYYFLSDYPDEMVGLMEVMHAKNLEAYEVIAESPAEVVIIYENTSTSFMSPYMYPKYVLEHLNDYADLFHEAGKLLLIHMCGTLRQIRDEIAMGRYDGIWDIAPPPTGDLPIAEAKRSWGEKFIVCGGIDATTFAMKSVTQIRNQVLRILESVSGFRGLVLGSGDAVPMDTPLDNLRAVTSIVEEHQMC